jgi:hypothetical protein
MNLRYDASREAFLKEAVEDGLTDKEIHSLWVKTFGPVSFAALRKKRQRLKLRKLRKR